MKTDCCCCDKAKVGAWIVGVAGTLLVMGVLVKVMLDRTAPPPVDAARVAERIKARQEITAGASEVLTTYGKVDEGKGVYRLPIDAAMRLTVQEWKNPAAARSNLLARLDKATAQPPPAPKAPEKPNQYE